MPCMMEKSWRNCQLHANKGRGYLASRDALKSLANEQNGALAIPTRSFRGVVPFLATYSFTLLAVCIGAFS
jgi:hypothetical protein